MRIMVFFDLPVLTGENKRNYRQFRKCLIKNGFIMLQESVYCKMITSPSVERSVNLMLQRNKPPEGLVQSLMITENQFVKMNYLTGEARADVVDSEERVIVL